MVVVLAIVLAGASFSLALIALGLAGVIVKLTEAIVAHTVQLRASTELLKGQSTRWCPRCRATDWCQQCDMEISAGSVGRKPS